MLSFTKWLNVCLYVVVYRQGGGGWEVHGVTLGNYLITEGVWGRHGGGEGGCRWWENLTHWSVCVSKDPAEETVCTSSVCRRWYFISVPSKRENINWTQWSVKLTVKFKKKKKSEQLILLPLCHHLQTSSLNRSRPPPHKDVLRPPPRNTLNVTLIYWITESSSSKSPLGTFYCRHKSGKQWSSSGGPTVNCTIRHSELAATETSRCHRSLYLWKMHWTNLSFISNLQNTRRLFVLNFYGRLFIRRYRYC